MFGAMDREGLIAELLRRRRMQQMTGMGTVPASVMNMTVGQLVALLSGKAPGGMLPPPVGLPPVALPPVVPPVNPGPVDPGPVDPGPVDPGPVDPGYQVN